MPGDPRSDMSKPGVDIDEVGNKLNEICTGWNIEDPALRNEFELRRLEAELVPQLKQLLEADISAEQNPELLDSVKEAISMFDNGNVIIILKDIKDKLLM
ncbi:MAG: hypothetical protein WC693_00165 [Patescibacteria group bacterium]|jgi:hypothetical protein